jgi:hypothetical protein
MFFISDFQVPMTVEKIISKPYRNEEARDSLFADILRCRPANLFMLGDLTMRGASTKSWKPLDDFLDSFKKPATSVYAIPGNHEYMSQRAGMGMFRKRFPESYLTGYLVTIDSVGVVMLNSNFRKMGRDKEIAQMNWYKSVMDSLDADPGTRGVIVCIHHPPYSNSSIVGSSQPVADRIVPVFTRSRKAVLFISGHSHNLEYFSKGEGKHFLVIGGGGGIAQPLIPGNARIHHDLVAQAEKPMYFYLVVEKGIDGLKLIARGFKKDFSFFELIIGVVPFNHF